jgi:ribonuclease HI
MTIEKKIIVYFDGLCEPVNPNGIATYGFTVSANGQALKEGRGLVMSGEGASNNIAEFASLLASLEWLIENGYSHWGVEIRGDSKQVISQMGGSGKAKRRPCFSEFVRARELGSQFSAITFAWVPRKQNAIADRLSRRAYEEYCIQTGRPITYSKH